MTTRTSPYLGLNAFEEDDRPLFFGRERDQETVVSALWAARLSILYGKPGVGKTSFLRAGVAPVLRSTVGAAVVVFRRWHGADALRSLKRAILDAVEVAGTEDAERAGTDSSKARQLTDQDLELPLDALLSKCALALGRPLFILLDQFEEYFLYHPLPTDPFDIELARAVNRDDIDVSFLVAIREDALGALERLSGRLPNVLGNLLRLDPVDRVGAERVIRRPLDYFNKQLPAGTTPMGMEDTLVKALVGAVDTGRIPAFAAGRGKPVDSGAKGGPKGIDTGLLQVVLERLFRAEEAAGSRTLRLSTFQGLGGADAIVAETVDAAVETLPDADRDLVSALLLHLITPSGTKVAHFGADLAPLVDATRADVDRVLFALTEARLLRSVADAGGQARHELAHDLIVPAVFDWQRRHALNRQRQRSEADLEKERQRAIEDRRRVDELASQALESERQRAATDLEKERRRASEAVLEEQRRGQRAFEGEQRRAADELNREKRRAQETLVRVRRAGRLRLLVAAAVTAGLLSFAGFLVVQFNTQARNARRDSSALTARAEKARVDAEERASHAVAATALARAAAARADSEAQRVKNAAKFDHDQQQDALRAVQAQAKQATELVTSLQAGVALVKAKLARLKADPAAVPPGGALGPKPEALPPELQK